MFGLKRCAHLVRLITRQRKFVIMITMTICFALAFDAVANDAVYSWMTIGVAFLSNGFFIPLTLFSMIKKLAKSTKLLCCIFGGVLFYYTNIQVSESWTIKFDLLSRMPSEATAVQTEGVRQLYLVATLCKFISYLFVLDFFCTCFMEKSEPAPVHQSTYYRRPLDTVSYMRIKQLRDFRN